MKERKRLGTRHSLPKVEHKVFVATPCYDGKVHADFALSMAQAVMHATHQKIGVLCQTMGNSAFIEVARNIFVKNFLETDCDYLFFIDSDLKFESRAFVGLIQSGREVCAGAYRKRQEPEEYPLHYIEDKANPGIELFDGGWVGCDRVATGFLCIHRSVIEAMVAVSKKVYIHGEGEIPWLFETRFQEDEDNTKFMCEDYAWCDDYRAQFGKPVWVWPDFDFWHDGYFGNWHAFMQRQIKAEGEINLIKAAK